MSAGAVASVTPANPLSSDVWRLWVREYGAANAIAYALRSGYTRQQIRQANDECIGGAHASDQTLVQSAPSPGDRWFLLNSRQRDLLAEELGLIRQSSFTHALPHRWFELPQEWREKIAAHFGEKP